MAKLYTTEEFEALVRERVKPPVEVKFAPPSAEERRAKVIESTRSRREIVRKSCAAAAVRRRRAYSRNLRALAEVMA